VTIARHLPAKAEARRNHGIGLPLPGPRAAHTGPDAIDSRPLTRDYSDEVVLLARLKPGRALESRRVVHVFALASEPVADYAALTARCGERLLVDDLHWLPALAGMPCESCVAHSVAERL
jgi:hypothetical protein